MKKKKEREKMGEKHYVAQIVTFCLSGRNRDVRVKHLVMQPGNAPEARPSHLTTADKVNKVSEGLAFKDHIGQVLQRMQTLNWDTDTHSPAVRPHLSETVTKDCRYALIGYSCYRSLIVSLHTCSRRSESSAVSQETRWHSRTVTTWIQSDAWRVLSA